MSEEAYDPIDHAFRRLAAAYNPPETEDKDLFRSEFRIVLKGFSREALIEGVSEVLKTRRHKTFPSLGEIRAACMNHVPAQPMKHQVDMTKAYRDEDERRAGFVKQLRQNPRLKKLIADGMHNAALEFAMRNNRFPNQDDWPSFLAEHAKVQAHIEEATGPNPHPIVTKLAEAILYRRARLEEELIGQRQEAAE